VPLTRTSLRRGKRPARFSIGIDLGTTNSTLAFVSLDGDAESEVLAIPQWDSPSATAEAPTLPSFLYLPEDAVKARLKGEKAADAAWIVGRLARAKAAECPDRVAHSAKSWLCHRAADCRAPFLPWGSAGIAAERKISPVRACALILEHLRDAWNARFAAAGAGFAFDSQNVTVTVPASFDASAQRLILAAAQEAGFPVTVGLLEEPQAAFYRWLEKHDFVKGLWATLSGRGAGPHHVVVVDIGGGTSDFSLFELRPNGGGGGLGIERVAVSKHILLGGDNMDLAVARRLEPQLVSGAERLSGGQWAHLIARCRDAKEKALSSEGPPDEAFTVSIPGRGSSLVARARSARIARAEIEELLLDGFFPECDAHEAPIQTKAALGEWGLPYAADPAVTRHLAEFLKDRPAVDAVLFNGGSLHPRPLRQRIRREIGKWQRGPAPIVLENPEPAFAVARGAALFGKIARSSAQRIEVGSAHVVLLEAGATPSAEVDASEAENARAIFHRRIQERAYALWEVQGRPEGRQLDHWAQAELEAYATARNSLGGAE
jgi:molecular chaperone DnaK (HSP70)